jgi:protein-tyrosine phosphatase
MQPQVQILSRPRLRQKLTESPGEYCAIIISEPVLYPHNISEVDDLFSLCKDYLDLRFNDVVDKSRSGAPVIDHVKQALEWIEKHPNEMILVACRAGISRSSAIAYLIESKRTNPETAIKALNPKTHYPNALLLRYGRELMGNEIVRPMEKFMDEVFAPYLD